MKSFALTTAVVAALSSVAASTPLASRSKWADWKDDSPFHFTSTYKVVAVPEEVINGTSVTPGEPGAIGYYNYGINSDLDVICYVSLVKPSRTVGEFSINVALEHHSIWCYW